MTAEIITVGNDLLLGNTRLSSAGAVIRRIINLGIKVGGSRATDGNSNFRKAVSDAKENNDIVVFKLDSDADLSIKSQIAREWGDSLAFSEKSYNDILEYARKNGIKPTEAAREQAYIPKKGRIMRLDGSRAVATVLIDGEKLAVILQCDDDETQRLLDEKVVPLLSKLVSGAIVTKYVNIIGTDIPTVRQKLADINMPEGASISYFAKRGELSAVITAKAETRPAAEEISDRLYSEIDGRIHNYIYGVNAANIETVIVDSLAQKGKTVAVAEDITGSEIAHRISQTKNGDKVFSLGITAVSDRDKTEHLGVSRDDIATYTAVSTPVAVQMARYVQKTAGADYAIAANGRFAAAENPAETGGTVYVAVRDENNVYVKRCEFSGDKKDAVNLASQAAFDLLRCVVNNLPSENTRVYDNDAVSEREEEPEKKPGFFAVIFRVILLVILSFAIACGYLYARNSGALDKLNLPKLSLSSVTTQISAIFDREIDIPTTISERRTTDFFARGFDRKTLKMFGRLKGQSPEYTCWLTFKSAKKEYPVADGAQNAKTEYDLWLDSDFAADNIISIHGLTAENCFDFTDLETVRGNSHIMLYTDDAKCAQIFSVGTFSKAEYEELKAVSDKAEFAVSAIARSLYDVDVAVRENDEIIVLTQKLSDDEYAVVFAVSGDAGVYPSVDIKTNTVYADWYREKANIHSDNSARALLYAWEVWDRNNYTPFVPGQSGDSSSDIGDSVISLSLGSSRPSGQSLSSAASSSLRSSSSLSRSSSKPGASSASPSKQSSVRASSAVSSENVRSSQTVTASSAPADSASSSAALPSSENAPSSRGDPTPRPPTEEILTVTMNGRVVSGPASQILAQIVAIEMSSSWNVEALKAQAVATHSYLEFMYNRGTAAPAVSGRTNPSQKVIDAVSEVSDVIMTYGGMPINAVYTASAAGYTNPSNQVWSVTYPYLVSVESKYDYLSAGYEKTYTFTAEKLKEIIESKVNVTLDLEDCENWISVVDYTDGGYVRRMNIGGATTYNGGKRNITGYYFATDILARGGTSLRSAAFTYDYNADTQTFTFVTKGYGHGVGLSQWGAQFYAAYEGWDFRRILSHYYTGITFTTK